MRGIAMEEGWNTPALFYLTPAVPASTMIESMRTNILRCLPEAKVCKPHGLTMSIAGGGPSLEDTYEQMEGVICAVNGSLQWLIDRGLKEGVSYMCGVCDASPHIADMVPAHPDVRYYIASLCDPALFDKLINAGCDVHIWHITPDSTEDPEGITQVLNDEYDNWFAVGGGCTMGLRWINLGHYLGFRRFHLHGMDSSFRDGHTHAYPDRADSKGHCEINGRSTRVNFVAQVGDFADMLREMHRIDPRIEIEVFGDGLLQDEWKAFRAENPTAFSPYTARGAALLRRLPPEGELVGAEVGVFCGKLSRHLLHRPGLRLMMIDAWTAGYGMYHDQTAKDWHQDRTQAEHDHYKLLAHQNTDFAKDRRDIQWATSDYACGQLDDECLDFVFLDAEHSYLGLKNDIDHWWWRIKPGGVLGGHDYDNPLFPGVKKAVDEFVQAEKLTLDLDEDMTWFLAKTSA